VARLKPNLDDVGPCEGDTCVLPKSPLEPLALQRLQPLDPGSRPSRPRPARAAFSREPALAPGAA
jgi:hypothetical protein